MDRRVRGEEGDHLASRSAAVERPPRTAEVGKIGAHVPRGISQDYASSSEHLCSTASALFHPRFSIARQLLSDAQRLVGEPPIRELR